MDTNVFIDSVANLILGLIVVAFVASIFWEMLLPGKSPIAYAVEWIEIKLKKQRLKNEEKRIELEERKLGLNDQQQEHQ